MLSPSPIPTCLTLLTWALLATAAAGAQTTWHVDDDAPNDPGPGDPTVSDPLEDGSAEHPFDAIQEGIDAAVNGDTVLVLDGTYTGEGNRDIDFGGRLITVRSENGPDTCIIDCEDDGRGFHFHNDETGDAVVEGFTIRNGSAYRGGGIYCDYSNPTLTNCTFRENYAYYGGGMYNYRCSPAVTNCTFVNNVAFHGGAMYNYEQSSPTVINCTLDGNTATFDAGGMKNSYRCHPTVINCTFRGNSAAGAGGGGGMRNSDRCQPTVANCTFTGNSAGGDGGGMRNSDR